MPQYVARLHTSRANVLPHQTSFYGASANLIVSWGPGMLSKEPANSWVDVFLVTDWLKGTEEFVKRYTKAKDGKIYETITEIAGDQPAAESDGQEPSGQADAGEKQ